MGIDNLPVTPYYHNPEWTPEFLREWARERAIGIQTTIDKRLMLTYLQELNWKQAARIMELELQLQFQKRRWQALKPEFKCTEETLPSLKYSRYYRNDNE